MSPAEDGGAVEGRAELVRNLWGGCVTREKRWSGDTFSDLGSGVIDESATDQIMAKAADQIESDAAEITRLRAEVERLSKPDMFWFWQDPEYACEGWQEALEETGSLAEVIRFQTAHELPDRWGTNRVLTVDENGDPDETEPALFDTESEASACWPDSLAAARSALGDQP